MKQSLVYRADIDGLRAVAVLLVCVFHFALLPIGSAGFIGVDLFFVISGFLITGILADGLESGGISLTDFYYRRVRRLYPALLTVLLAYLIAGYALFFPALFLELGKEALYSSTYVINIFLWRSVDYFGFQAHSKPLLHMWSLAVEEQFYLIFPLLMIGLARLFGAKSPRLIWVLALLGLGSFGLGWLASLSKPQMAFYLLPTRAWELMAGGVLALVLRRYGLPAWLAQAAGPLALAILALALAIHHPDMPFPGWFAALPVASALLFLLGGQAKGAPLTQVMASAPMVFVGKISYPLYLVHWPVKILADNLLPEVTPGWRWFGFALSVLLAWLIYRFVETPVRHGRVLLRPRAFLPVAAGVQALVLALALGVVAGRGLPQRFGPDMALLTQARAGWMDVTACLYGGGAPRLDCRLGDPQAPARLLMIGDSHSEALAPALDLYLRARGEAAYFVYERGCMPVLDSGAGRCWDFTRRVFQAAADQPEIRQVLLVSAWTRPYDDAYEYVGVTLRAGANIQAFETHLARTLDLLQAAGKAVVLVDPVYWPRHNVPETQLRKAAFGIDWPLDRPRAEYDARFAHLLATFERLQAEGRARHLSLIDDLCAGGTCRALWDGGPVFYDDNHIAPRMAPHFASVLAQKLPR